MVFVGYWHHNEEYTFLPYFHSREIQSVFQSDAELHYIWAYIMDEL